MVTPADTMTSTGRCSKARQHQRRATLVAVAGASGVAFVLFALPLFTGLAYFGLDHTRVTLGTRCAIDHALANDLGLLLAPTLGNSGVLALDPLAQIFYPPAWLTRLFSAEVGASVDVVVHLTGCAAATALLARSFRLRSLHALMAGLFCAFSGTMVNLIEHSTYIVSATWLPLAWAAARYAMKAADTRPALALVVVAVSGCFLGGEPQGGAVAIGLVVMEALAGQLRRHRRDRRARLAALMAALAVGGFVSAALWWPTLAELALGNRAGALPSSEAFAWAFGPSAWLSTVWPGIWVTQITPWTTLWQVMTGGTFEAIPWNLSPYLGPTFLVLVLVGAHRRAMRVPLVVAVTFLGVAAGDHLPLLPALAKVTDLATWFRYPAKYLVVATPALAVIAAAGVHRLARRRAALRFVAGGLAVIALQLAAFLWLRAHGADLDALAAEMKRVPIEPPLPRASQMLASALWASALPLALAVLVCVVRRRLAPVVGALVIVDLLVAASGVVGIGPRLLDAASPLTLLPPSPSAAVPAILCVEPALLRATTVTAGEASPWTQALFVRRFGISELQACERLSSPTPYSPAAARLPRALEADGTPAALRALGCTYVVRTAGVADDGWRSALPDDVTSDLRRVVRIEVAAVDDPLPPSFVARNPVLVASEDDARALIGEAAGGSEVLAIIDDPTRAIPARTPLPSGAGIDVERVVVDGAARRTLYATGTGSAVIGVRASYLAGWEATQSGRALPTVRAGGAQLAVVVEDVARGPIELRYRPPRRRAALACVVAALASMVATVVLAEGARRRRGARAGPTTA